MDPRSSTSEWECDSLPYPLVRACRKIGLRDPEDVRWCRLSHVQNPRPRWRDLFRLGTWKVLLGLREPGPMHCCCGLPLPLLERYTFTLKSGRQEYFLLGQCETCRAIYWEEP
jgi:hypothetical protein